MLQNKNMMRDYPKSRDSPPGWDNLPFTQPHAHHENRQKHRRHHPLQRL
jgi:hypothetical protein